MASLECWYDRLANSSLPYSRNGVGHFLAGRENCFQQSEGSKDLHWPLALGAPWITTKSVRQCMQRKLTITSSCDIGWPCLGMGVHALRRLYCDCLCSVSLPLCVMGWYAACECGIFQSYTLFNVHSHCGSRVTDYVSFFLNTPWKWNSLVSPNYFIFIGYLKTGGGGECEPPLDPSLTLIVLWLSMFCVSCLLSLGVMPVSVVFSRHTHFFMSILIACFQSAHLSNWICLCFVWAWWGDPQVAHWLWINKA